MSPTVFDFEAVAIDGTPHPLERHRGKVLLVVNTASACGFTPQLAGLETLHRQYAAAGLVVLGFPCNQFGRQDPGSNAEIGAFCEARYGVSFPLMAKVEVNGPQAHFLFRWLKRAKPGVLGTEAIKWNFTKFLVGRDGRPLKRFAPRDPPQRLVPDIEAALAARVD